MTARRILIADDEPKLALSLGLALERLNGEYRVSVVHSGEDALEALNDSPVDLLVTDLRLPGINGLELIRWARLTRPGMRTILITAHGSDEVEAEARRLGTDRYLAKPFHMRDFTQAVREALSLSNAERALAEAKRLRDELISLIFYELRAPLTYILNYASLLAEPGQDSHRELAQPIVRHALRMRETLDDLTPLAEWGIEQALSQPQPVNLQQALEAAVIHLASLATERDQTLQVLPASELIWIIADAWLLGVLLVGLISSAMGRVPAGAQVSVDAVQEDRVAVVAVRGNSKAHEFAPAELYSGLTVARGLAEALGGELQAASKVGGDVVFRLTLPIGFGPRG